MLWKHPRKGKFFYFHNYLPKPCGWQSLKTKHRSSAFHKAQLSNSVIKGWKTSRRLWAHSEPLPSSAGVMSLWSLVRAPFLRLWHVLRSLGRAWLWLSSALSEASLLPLTSVELTATRGCPTCRTSSYQHHFFTIHNLDIYVYKFCHSLFLDRHFHFPTIKKAC
jgi:hypothetical protein